MNRSQITYKPWLAREEQYLREHHATSTVAHLAAVLERTPASVKNRSVKLGLRGRPNPGQFYPGHSIRNQRKGQPQPKLRATQFGHGKHHPKSIDGAVSLRRVDGRLLYRVRRAGKWVDLHRENWEAVNGPLPTNCVLRCRTGDTTNPAAANWECVTRAAHAQRNANRAKQAETMREHWQVVKRCHADGLTHRSGLARQVARVLNPTL